jgi:glycosyltransferase involved in cell wall biosynthesis
VNSALEHSVFVEFEAATLSPLEETASPVRPYKIGWLVKSLDVNSASIRYRCFHFARVLSPRFKSIYFTSSTELQKAIHDLDAIIIVKRVDKGVPTLVAKARLHRVPIFLDLCDDMLALGYVKNEFGVNLVRFLGIVPFLAGVTVPSARMADRIEEYARDNGYPALAVHVVPDIAETWDIYRATYRAVTGRTAATATRAPARPAAHGPKKVVWFGNYGASHSNFGIFSLRPTLKSLKAVNHDIPLELVIISNNEAVYKALVHHCGFATRFVPWSAQAVYSELASAHAALLTTGDDDFCDIKSSSRVLQAFAAGVPVITAKGSAITEFDDAIAVGRMKDALRACLGPSRDRFVPPRLASAQRVLARYTPQRIAGIWADLLKTAIRGATAERAAARRHRYLIILEPGDDVKMARALLSVTKALPDMDYVLLVSSDLVERQPNFGSVLRLSRKFPRFFSGALEGTRNLLVDCAAVIVERPSAPVAKFVAGYAAQDGVPVLTSAEAAMRLRKQLPLAPSLPAAPKDIQNPGPFDEYSRPDGSVDWAFVVNGKARGWILDAICREIGSRQPDSWRMIYHPEAVPDAKNVFFSHYALFQAVAENHPEQVANSNTFVWYTHPREENAGSVAKLLLAFDQVSKVIFACESNRRLWVDRGLPSERTAVVLGAADPQLFRFHERGAGVIGLSSSFYERKNPDRLLQVIKLLPHREFVLVGRNWNQYALFEEMKARPNFTYKTAAYRDYPEIYSTFDVFLSISSLEGGPIPLVEAMMSNAVPVASKTGFAPDLIEPGENGFLFDPDAPADKIAQLIEAAFELPGNIRQTVERYSWDNFSSQIMKLAE